MATIIQPIVDQPNPYMSGLGVAYSSGTTLTVKPAGSIASINSLLPAYFDPSISSVISGDKRVRILLEELAIEITVTGFDNYI